MTPTVGRIVHFHRAPYSDALPPSPMVPLAAMIIEVMARGGGTLEEERFVVRIKVFSPFGGEDELVAPFSATPKPAHWSWPPRVP